MTTTLIIDDHALFNDGLALILKQSKQFKVLEQVYDSRHAFHKCFSLRPALVIVDYNMPHLNGLEVVKQIKSLGYDCKILIVSMYADQKEITLFEELGVDGYINKTTPANELIKALITVIKGEKVFLGNSVQKAKQSQDSFTLKHRLTKREIDILKLLKEDFSTEQIAVQLNLSYYTIETHRKNINQKMNFTTKKEFYEFLNKFIE